MRAVASNADLGRIAGLPVDRIAILAFVVGSCLAAVAGILFSLDTPISPMMGSGPLLLAIVAVIVGGAYRTPGIIVATVCISLLQHVIGWLWQAEWRDPAVLGLLVIVLLLQRRAGPRDRAGEVAF